LLPVEAVVRLRGACKALKALVAEWPMRLGGMQWGMIEAALTCFPATESLMVVAPEALAPAEACRLVEVLRGHGGKLKDVKPRGKGAERLLSSAVRAGALPKTQSFKFSLQNPIHREILSGGMLGLLEQVAVAVAVGHEDEIAALEHLRRLPHLRGMYLTCGGAQGTAFPPFIPPSLKALSLSIKQPGCLLSVLRELPPMLQASGARLESIEMFFTGKAPADCGAALAQVLRACSSTLKGLRLQTVTNQRVLGPACARDVVPGLTSCCDTLEVLHCPWAVFKALSAACPTFPRLVTLSLEGGANEAIELASPAWDVMANGRLPALARLVIGAARKFSSACHPAGGPGKGARRLARALEAVAGTLRRLTLTVGDSGGLLEGGLTLGACYELGAAIGKLRRLRYLQLGLFSDVRAYHDVGRGLAASGGCPELLELRLDGAMTSFDCLTHEPSLIVPSVRELWIHGRCTEEEALLLCCGLLQPGLQASRVKFSEMP
jgi:hypothetical protein